MTGMLILQPSALSPCLGKININENLAKSILKKLTNA
jgi:hypothetical protein